MFDKHITRMHFERAADSYDSAAALQREVAKRLFDRLDAVEKDSKQAITGNLLDIGCGTGYITKELLRRYPNSEVFALDIAHSMVSKTNTIGLCADAELLPFKAGSINFIASGLMLQWSNDLSQTFTGFRDVLVQNGLFLFSTFGPKTLTEIRQSWGEVDDQPHTSRFSTCDEIKQMLMNAGYQSPVIDSEIITMNYDSVRQLMREIKQIGASNTDSHRSKGLMGKAKLKAFEEAYERFKTAEGLYPASWEIIYGYAWVK